MAGAGFGENRVCEEPWREAQGCKAIRAYQAKHAAKKAAGAAKKKSNEQYAKSGNRVRPSQGEPSYVVFLVHRLTYIVWVGPFSDRPLPRTLVYGVKPEAEASVAPWSVLLSASAAPIGLQPLGAASQLNRTEVVGAVGQC